jgi:hypothetical protein
MAGTSRGLSTVSSWVWFAWTDSQQSRGLVHSFAAGVQVVGPPAYNPATRRLFVPVRDHSQSSKRLVIYQLELRADAFLAQATVFYEQMYASVAQSLALVTPFVPGFSILTDTSSISMVDEQLQSIMVFTCSTTTVCCAQQAQSSPHHMAMPTTRTWSLFARTRALSPPPQSSSSRPCRIPATREPSCTCSAPSAGEGASRSRTQRHCRRRTASAAQGTGS